MTRLTPTATTRRWTGCGSGSTGSSSRTVGESVHGHGGQSVLRAGFAVTSTREQFNITGVWGANQGRTINTSVDPVNNAPEVFGPAGSVLFRNDNLPVRTVASTPSYPIAVTAGTSVNEYDPN